MPNGHRSATRRRWLRGLHFKQQKHHKRGGCKRFIALSKRNPEIFYVRIRTPATIASDNEGFREDLCRILSEIRRTIFSSNKTGIVVDFSNTTTIQASGMLLLLAEIDRILRIIRNPIRIKYKRSKIDRINQVLQQIGFSRLLGDMRDDPVDDDTVRYWCYATGVLADGSSGGQVLERYEGRLTEGITKGLYAGIVETMTNTIHHAYQGPRKDGSPAFTQSRWWMLSEERDNKLTVALCDLGIGIPRSLPRSNLFDRERFDAILAKLNRKRDLASIKAAIEFGRSRTGQVNRGKGLPQILDAVTATSNGYVSISSNKGVYRILAGRPDPVEIEATNSILGTLIQWQVPIVSDGSVEGSTDGEPTQPDAHD